MTDKEKKALEKIEDFLTTNIIVLISNDETANSEELKAFISKNEYLSIEFIASMFLKQYKEIEDYIENKELINQTLGLEKDSDINKTLEKIIILNNYEDKIKEKIEEYEEKCKNCNFRGKICEEFKQNYNCTIAMCLKEFYSL